MIFAIIQVVLAYVVADALAALYHLATDCGFNTPRIVAQFRKHHDAPRTMTFDLEPAVGGIVLLLLSHLWAPWFLSSLGVFVSFAQVPHYFTHHPAPRAVKWLQWLGLILRPRVHAAHHYGKFDRDFCVISGWNNFWINAIVRRSPWLRARLAE